MLATCVQLSLALLLALLPFELYAGIGLAGLTFTNVELLALATLALWGAALLSERRWPRLPRWLVALLAMLLAIFVASALLAPEWRGAALKFSARQAQGALLALCLADQLARHGRPLARRLLLTLLAGAAVSAALGLLELLELPPLLALLAIFKDQPTMAGGLLRLSASFAYANIAAMYYEATLPLALAALALAATWRARLLALAAAVLLFSAALLTYSRAALLTVCAAVALVAGAGLLWQRRSAARAAWRVLGLGVVLLAFAAGLLLLSPSFRVRMAEPDLANWYRAAYTLAPLPQLAPNQLIQTPVSIQNRGSVTWRSAGLRPVALSYHWLDPRTRLVLRFNGRRTLLPQPVGPGEISRLNASVQAPDRAGTYLLVWDMVVEHSNWFSERGNPVAEVAVTVAGAPAPHQAAPAADAPGMPERMSIIPQPPPRSQLWSAALQLWRRRPLVGIGPDVFRHVYGPVLGMASWDQRIHSNSLYLELLADTGIAGLLSFLALVGCVMLRAVPIARAAGWRGWAVLGCCVGLAAFLIHGAVDMFLEYSATYMLMWGLLGALSGLAASEERGERSESQGPLPEDHGPRSIDQGLQTKDHGSRIANQKSGIGEQGATSTVPEFSTPSTQGPAPNTHHLTPTPLPSSPNWLRVSVVPLGVFAASRLGLGLLLYFSLALLPMREGMIWRAYPGNLLLDGWVRWDAAWYRDIAAYGYRNMPSHEQVQRDTAFFPLYPLLMRALNVLIPDLYLCGLLISNIAFLAALLILYQLISARFSSELGLRAITLMAIYPFSFFFGAVYSESLFLLAVVAAFACAERKRWHWAGLCAAAAGATRLVGIVVVLGLAVLYFEQVDFAWRRVRPDALWLLLGVLGTAAYMGFLALRFGDPLQFVRSQYVAGWGAGVGLRSAWQLLRDLSLEALLAGQYPLLDLMQLLLFPCALALGWLAWRRISPAYAVWSICTLLLSFALWRSMGRFVAVVFPVFIVGALLLGDQRRYQFVAYISVLLLALLSVMYAHFYWVA